MPEVFSVLETLLVVDRGKATLRYLSATDNHGTELPSTFSLESSKFAGTTLASSFSISKVT